MQLDANELIDKNYLNHNTVTSLDTSEQYNTNNER